MRELDVAGMLESMAQYGQPPDEGCALFGAGYEDAFERLTTTYLERAFDRGSSAEKFIVGPFGSGKTHFLRQFMEIARERGCATAEVQLHKDVEFAQPLIVFREVAAEIRAPNSDKTGIRQLLIACLEQVRSKAPDPSTADRLIEGWINGLDESDFELESFGRVAKKGLRAQVTDDDATFKSACRWLMGDVADRILAKDLSEAVVPRDGQGLHGRRALLSLYQLIHYAGFHGTVIGFDEAEQGLTVDKKKTQRILSMLQSGINEVVALRNGPVLIMFAITPDLRERFEDFEALRQRMSDPIRGRGFFDGTTLAPVIDLTQREDVVAELRIIGRRLVALVFDHHADEVPIDRGDVERVIDNAAETIGTEEIQSSNRRTMVKHTSAILSELMNSGQLIDSPVQTPDQVEGEV